MAKNFIDILNIARWNVRENKVIKSEDAETAAKIFLHGLMDEVAEVEVEIKENNSIRLADELSDIAWDFAVLMALMEDRGLIDDAEDVIDHGFQKYTERSPAMKEASIEMWNEIKAGQKEELAKRHQEKYGAG